MKSNKQQRRQPPPRPKKQTDGDGGQDCAEGHVRTVSRLLTAVALLLIAAVAVAIRVLKSVRFGTLLDEYEPYFNQYIVGKMSEDGIVATMQSHDNQVWYPYGRQIGSTILPGLTIVTTLLHSALHFVFGPSINVEHLCVYFPPICAAFSAVTGFFLTAELWRGQALYGRRKPTDSGASSGQAASMGAGLFTAAFTAMLPGMLPRTLSGNFTNESLGGVLMLLFFQQWLVCLRLRTTLSAMRCGVVGFLLAATWDGYVFALNVVAVHVIVLVVSHAMSGGNAVTSNTFSVVPKHLFRAYSVTYTVCAILATMLPFYHSNGGVLNFVFEIPHAIPLSVLAYLQFCAAFHFLHKRRLSANVQDNQSTTAMAGPSLQRLRVYALLLSTLVAAVPISLFGSTGGQFLPVRLLDVDHMIGPLCFTLFELYVCDTTVHFGIDSIRRHCCISRG